MESLFLLIPLAVLFAALSVGALFWAIRHGQFDDLENAGHSILFDADSPIEAAPADAGNRDHA
jgi:cbb3-type cytochrome oxidase maturation protein